MNLPIGGTQLTMNPSTLPIVWVQPSVIDLSLCVAVAELGSDGTTKWLSIILDILYMTQKNILSSSQTTTAYLAIRTENMLA